MNNRSSAILSYLILAGCAALSALSYHIFVLQNSFAPSGLNGLATMLQYVCGFRIGWIYTVFKLPAYHTLSVLFASYPISWIATFVVELLTFFILHRRIEQRNNAKLASEGLCRQA